MSDETKCKECGRTMGEHPVPYGDSFEPRGKAQIMKDEKEYTEKIGWNPYPPIGGWICEGFVDPEAGEGEEPGDCPQEYMLEKRKEEIERVQPAFQVAWMRWFYGSPGSMRAEMRDGYLHTWHSP